MNRWQ